MSDEIQSIEEARKRIAALEEAAHVAELRARVAEERAAWASDTLEHLQTMARIGFFAYDLGTKKFEWSDPVFELFGRSPEEGPPSVEQCAAALSNEQCSQARRLFRRLLASGDPFTIEHPFHTPDGEVRWAVTTARLAGTVEAPLRVIGTTQDVTARHEIEEQLKQATKMEAVGRLAGGIAHDFNNMLTAIMSFTAFAIDQADPDSTLHEDLQQVSLAADRAAAVTSRLLAFSRRRTVRPHFIEIDDTLAQMSKLLRRLIGEDIEFQVDLNSTWTARVDPAALEQVLVNLVVNARDAMPRGGTITVRTLDLALAESLSGAGGHALPGDYVCLEVSDSGVGMDESTQRRIFDPFFTTKGLAEGTGLGLSTCYGIVRQARGFIDVQSAPGEGTTFRILLPRTNGDPPTPDLPARVATEGSEHILVVDDDPLVREIAVRALEDAGYDVEAAGTPTDAIGMAEIIDRLDLLVVDVVLPEMTGTELARIIADRFPHMSVLFISGYFEDPGRQLEIDVEPGIRVLAKPFTPERLCTAIRDALDGDF